MTFFWDIQWVFAIGILFAVIGYSQRKRRSRALVISFGVGLFVSVTLMLLSIWTYIYLDPEWMVNYFFVPTADTVALSIIYPLFYGIGFLVTSYLIQTHRDRFFYVLFALFWITTTLLLWDRFFLLFANTSSPEWWWELTATANNFIFIPTPTYSLGPFGLAMTFAVFFSLGAMLIGGIYIALHRPKCDMPNYDAFYCYVPEQ